MNKLNNAIERFCILHPNFGIRNLMIYIVACNIGVYLLDMFSRGSGLSALLYFSLDRLLHFEVWRLITWVFIPEAGGAFYLLISCYFYYWIGTSLERQWGTAKFTCYYLGGMVFTLLGAILVSLLTGYPVALYGAGYVNFAMFLAFAMLWPDAQVLLFFIIPIRIKYLAYLDLGFFAIRIVSYIAAGMWFQSIVPLMALLNFVVMFWPDLQRFFHTEKARTRQAAHFHNTAASARRQAQQPRAGERRCSVCGRTNLTNPELDFRYCSRCAGYHCFCSDHIFSHVHFTDENP